MIIYSIMIRAIVWYALYIFWSRNAKTNIEKWGSSTMFHFDISVVRLHCAIARFEAPLNSFREEIVALTHDSWLLVIPCFASLV